ncbi:endonuclease G [Herbaspirillum sp. Sphag1AN]|uniref:DNA/RNA non-specific endonuclease n=1 Tax=unclassified Herbaspirillum TaxID=2624150 RepID=UPI001609BA21|nr:MULTISPECIES: DNA/RNA non-specific endonuclease [unclassified Herbaspirillum]MBB3211635.1 endonuclease G [Herbaspirillum sp. Sphag1AN]MBB3245097.1 endonuclease G [Herbaspirillum sp. Sphag64]
MFKKWGVSLLFAVSSFASAQKIDFTQCPQFFANGAPPVVREIQQWQPRALCFDAFAVMHAGKTKTPLYVAERLNRAQLNDALDEKRTNRFYPEARLPFAERSQLDDYRASGYDRGHMAPAADMPTAQAMAQSFSLANMVPQAPVNNRKSWAGIERATRNYAMRAAGDVYVISGPVFAPTPATIGDGKVAVPAYLFKLVFDATTKRAWAYWIQNTDEAKAGKPISYAELVKRTGTDFLPGVAGVQ